MSTPMLKQYEGIKAQHRDAILLFRLGDFYEMFGQDARDGARLLGLTLTKRQDLPMCGVPHHAARTYVHRLLRAGRKVAICEQTSEPDGKSITERKVVEILSPGAVFDLDYLDPKTGNFIASICTDSSSVAIAWCDVSTGQLTVGAWDTRNDADAVLRSELARISPRELLVEESLLQTSRTLTRYAAPDAGTVVNRIPDWGFSRDQSYRRLTELFGVQSLQGFGISPEDPALAPVSALIEYLEDNAQHAIGHVSSLSRYRDTDTVILDDATIRNLELVTNLQDGGAGYTLLGVIDRCTTAMGSRLLRRSILEPLRQVDRIEHRLNRVEHLYRAQATLQTLKGRLNAVYDLERLVGRLGVEKAHPKDVAAIAATIRSAEEIAVLLPDWYGPDPGTPTLTDTTAEQEELRSLATEIMATLDDDPAVAINEGGIIRPGFDDQLDAHRALRDHSREILDQYLSEQRTRTGIGSLKIKYNRVLGHFFEVPRSQAERLPEDFIRRQSLANAERFTTARLGELEDQINSAAELADERERELFLALRRATAASIPVLTNLARRLAEIDMFAGLATAATEEGWRRPTLTDEPRLDIRGGRHPVVEHHLPPGEFVENDIVVGGDTPRFTLITGPNMAGKSTVLRQAALIVLMAHVGSFVPADTALVGETDRIFCRVGASDNIARGESTFLVEMNETSNILRNATPRSLIIMDEVGRGTSTHDGLAIAWAVTEHLLNRTGSRTLFATHYHELTSVEHPEFSALGMAVEHTVDRIVFLKKLRPGAGDRSYGIDVARMAGLPEEVIARAREILARLEEGAVVPVSSAPATDDRPGATRDRGASRPPDASAAPTNTQNRTPEELFSPESILVSELKSIDPDDLAPRDALEMIYRWKQQIT